MKEGKDWAKKLLKRPKNPIEYSEMYKILLKGQHKSPVLLDEIDCEYGLDKTLAKDIRQTNTKIINKRKRLNILFKSFSMN